MIRLLPLFLLIQPFLSAADMALKTDGIEAMVTVPDSSELHIGGTVTLSVWAKHNGDSTEKPIIEKGGWWADGETNYGMSFMDHYFIFDFAGGYRAALTAWDSQWHHYAIVATHGEADPLMYFDGELMPITLREGPATIDLNGPIDTDLHFAAMAEGFYSALSINELRIWNIARSQSEIQEYMSKPLDPAILANAQSGLVGDWPMDEFEDLGVFGSGQDDLRDLSFFGHHGSSYGDPIIVEFDVPVRDPYFKYYLVSNFDLNGDGEISPLEASLVTSIDCSGRMISSLAGIEWFPSLESLDCSNNLISSLPVLYAPLLTLRCGFNELTELPDLSNLSGLITLECQSNLLTALPDLTTLFDLEFINFSDNQITIWPLFFEGRAARIKKTLGSNNLVTQTNSVASVTSLTELDLSGNPLEAAPPIEFLVNLTSLRLVSNGLTQIPNLANLINLQALDVSRNSISDLPGLSSLVSLETLNASANQFTVIPDLNLLTNLALVDFSRNPLTSIETLLLNLPTTTTSLNLSGLDLSNLPDFSRFTQLEELILSHNLFTSMPDFSNILTLKVLDISFNALQSVRAFPVLPNLQRINLSNTQQTNFPSIVSLTLTAIDISDNSITNLPDLSAIPALLEFRASNNQLSVFPLPANPGILKVLALDHNNFTALPDLGQLANLEELRIDNNLFTELPDLTGHSNLRTLTCQGNFFSSLDCPSITPLLLRSMDVFVYNPQNDNSDLTCENEFSLPSGFRSWGEEGIQFCHSYQSNILGFICFLNNNSICSNQGCQP